MAKLRSGKKLVARAAANIGSAIKCSKFWLNFSRLVSAQMNLDIAARLLNIEVGSLFASADPELPYKLNLEIGVS